MARNESLFVLFFLDRNHLPLRKKHFFVKQEFSDHVISTQKLIFEPKFLVFGKPKFAPECAKNEFVISKERITRAFQKYLWFCRQLPAKNSRVKNILKFWPILKAVSSKFSIFFIFLQFFMRTIYKMAKNVYLVGLKQLWI